MNVDSTALNQLIEFGIPREDAEECLARNSNNVERAANYYWGGDLEKDRAGNRWDESVFQQERDGVGQAVPTIHAPQPSNLNYLAQAADTVLRDPVGAKSRPPSRSTAFQIHSHDEDDPQLQQALKNSLAESQSSQPFIGPQVSGTVGFTGTSNFKPADSNTYHDPGSWAVALAAPSESNAIEIFPDPAPSERKRNPGEPAFLRPSTGSGNLGPLLTIMHSIPAARETFLQRDNVLDNYGQHERWWQGHVIQLARVLVEDDPDSIAPEDVEVIRECQRLMAFLTGTDRAYGTAESLGSLRSIFDLNPSNIIPRFLPVFKTAVQTLKRDPDALTPLESKAVRISPDHDPIVSVFEVFDLKVSSQLIEQGRSLYDALDMMFWDDEDGEDVETYAEYIGDVCTIQVCTEETGSRLCGIEIPPVLYFDRYTKEFKDELRKTKKSQLEIQSQIELLDEKERKIRLFSPMSFPKTNLDMVKVLQATKKYFEQSAASEVSSPEEEEDGPSTNHAKQCTETAKQLAEIEARIQTKIADLKAQRDELRKKLDQLKAVFTSPENTIEGAPKLSKYILRGVSTDRGVTYVKSGKIEVPLIDLEDEVMTETTTRKDGWWSMKYHTTQLAFLDEQYGGYEVKEVDEAEVLRAAKQDGQGLVLLVYAKETSDDIEQADIVLPEPLKAFVEQDNAYFAAEIANALKSQPSKKRYADWNKEPDSNVTGNSRSYMDQWNNTYTASSSRAATPGDSRRNSFSYDATMDTDNLTAVPEPPSPPTTSQGHNVHFAVGNEKGFRGAYGSGHEVMAAADSVPRKQQKVYDDSDEMTYGSQHVEFAEDGTLKATQVPPSGFTRNTSHSGGGVAPRLDLDD